MSVLVFLAEWALRSSMLILGAALLLWVLRVKDPSIRLAAWTAMLCGSLLIPVMTAVLPEVQLRVARPAVLAAAVPAVFEEYAPVTSPVAPDAPPLQMKSAPIDWTRAAVYLYIAVAFAMLLRLSLGLLMSRRFLRRARATGNPGIRESDRVAAPVTLGIIRPAIVLPANWRNWESAKLEAVLAHEQSHIRRYDPAVQFVSAIHRAILWFSPLSWFLHTRIVRVAEEASDDAAVAATGDRAVYAEVLLDFIQRATPQANLAGVSMARYGSPVGRIHRILDATSLSRGVTRWSFIAILALGAPLAYLAASAQTVTVVQHAIAAPIFVPSSVPGKPLLIAQATPTPAPQPAATARPKFDVASIKPCDPNAAMPGGRSGPTPTPRFRRECVTVMTLIQDAYLRFADGTRGSPAATVLIKIEGGPAWLNSDQYTIEAESDGAFTNQMKAGPMMQTLLEDRFQLRVHRETRESQVYALTEAKGGSKIQPPKPGPCVPSDFTDSPLPFLSPPPGMENMQCAFLWEATKGPNVIVSARNVTMQEIIGSLIRTMDRPVIDKTGITGKIDFRLTYAPDDRTPNAARPLTADQRKEIDNIRANVYNGKPMPAPAESADGVPAAEDPAGPSIFTALQQQLGLKLESAKGQREYLVIDSVSRPTPN